jgi:two-component system, response regulator
MEKKAIEILIVEDNKNDAELTVRILQKKCITNNIMHLRDGASALDFLLGQGLYNYRDTTCKPKIILLDLKMPKIDGLQVLQRIKSDELTRKIPVVVLTSSKESMDIEKAYTLGANSHIVKPVDIDEYSKSITETSLYWIALNQNNR